MNYNKVFSEFTKTSDIVKMILEKYPKARDDDFVLYGYVAHYCGFNIDQSMRQFLGTATQKGAPAFATVTKCRRTLQGEFPHLQGTKVEARKEMSMIYKAYNQENN